METNWKALGTQLLVVIVGVLVATEISKKMNQARLTPPTSTK
jgi:hypothetical protein